MRIIQYQESYGISKEKDIKLFLNLGWIFSTLIIFGYFLFIFILRIGGGYWWIFAIGGSLVLFFSVIKDKDYRWLNIQKGWYRKGIDGEIVVSSKLNERFDDYSYYYIRNYFNNQIFLAGDIDGILIGPRGIFLLEVKSWEGIFRISGTDFYRHITKYLYRLYYKNPIKQLLKNKEIISKYLIDNGLILNVQAFIVFADGEIEKFDKNIGIYITKPEEIANKILERPNQNLTQDQIKKALVLFGVN